MNTEAEQQLLHHARNGNAEEVRRLLEAMARMEVAADIDCKGEFPALACYKPHMCLFNLFNLDHDKSHSPFLGRTPHNIV